MMTVHRAWGDDVENALKAVAAKHHDVVVDVPGRNSAELRAAMLVADVMVLPQKLGPFDTWTIEPMAESVTSANDAREEMGLRPLRVLVVLNCIDPQAKHVIDDARAFMANIECMTLAATVIRKRAAFDKAIGQGRTVRELVRKIPGKEWLAAQEIFKLREEVFSYGDD